MVFFISRSTRDALGIDTIERGIVLALLLLRNACTSEDKDSKYYNAIKISTSVRGGAEDTYQSNFNATAKIPYQSNLALLGGMNLLQNLKNVSDLRVLPTFRRVAPTQNAPPLPEEPYFIDTLEKYLVWASQILSASLLPDIDNIKLSFFEDDPIEPSLIINYVLPIDWEQYMLTNNLIGSTKLIATEYDEGIYERENTLISNQGIINNLALLGN